MDELKFSDCKMNFIDLSIAIDSYKTLLSLYLSGAVLSNSSKILYPFLDRPHSLLSDKILIIKKTLALFCQIDGDKKIDELLAITASMLEDGIYKFSPFGRKTRIRTKKFVPPKYSLPPLAPINQFQRFVKENMDGYLIDAYLHGSISTYDFTQYSDLDTLFIIKNETLKSVDKLKAFRRKYIKSLKYLYKFDPLQHHPHFILAEFELYNYNQSFLPVSALKLMTSLLAKQAELELVLNRSDKNTYARFRYSLMVVKNIVDSDPSMLRNPYKLKSFLSHIMILPALYLQTQGSFVSKKDSFELFKSQVPGYVWDSIDHVSSIRMHWKQSCSWLYSLLLKCILQVNPLLFPYFSRKVINVNVVSRCIIDKEFFASVDNLVDFLTNSTKGHINGQEN